MEIFFIRDKVALCKVGYLATVVVKNSNIIHLAKEIYSKACVAVTRNTRNTLETLD